MRGCKKYGIIRKKGFLYLDNSRDIQFRVPGDITRPIEHISPEELAAGMVEILKCNGLMEKKDMYRALVGQREQVKKPTSDLGDLLTRAQDKILHFLLQSFGIYAIVKMLSV